ncbi:MAG: biopolymer transporter ExbD [Opitutales bacterium]|jgi:biopolymer transport protein ExbD|nr:biopolymer transporter ExbD [Opitutales bacterium]
MKRRLSIYRADQVEINVSPLIDMVFILLIFFIVATSFVNEIGLTSRHQDTSDPLRKLDEPLVFDVTAGNQVLRNGRNLGVSGVSSVVRTESVPKPQPVILRVEAGARASLAVQVMDAALGAGAKAVKMAAID